MSSLADRLLALAEMPGEVEWLEFKQNDAEPQEIGEYLSAVANAAALHGKDRAYIFWGIANLTHELVGTTFKPREARIGNEELENWLTTQLKPQIHFWIHEFEHNGRSFVVFEVEPSRSRPVAFKNREYIRVGSYKKPLSKHPEKEAVLWRLFARESFESDFATLPLPLDETLDLIAYRDYFSLLNSPVPESPEMIAGRLAAEDLIKAINGDRYRLTNLGAILFAKNLNAFDALRRKRVRVVIYEGNNRIRTSTEIVGEKGYASGFKRLVAYIVGQLPKSEEIREALRVDVPRYPEIAIRELVANALIHQDFEATGTGPMVEIFKDRVEISNPGTPLIDVQRFLDLRKSRNEKLAQLTRMLNICEERGSGIDKVLASVEVYQLPAPDFQAAGEHTKAILFGPKEFRRMTKQERVRACYQHAGLQWLSNNQMTNESLRKRFSISEKNKASASRIIADTLSVGWIKPFDPTGTSRRYAKYIPYWA